MTKSVYYVFAEDEYTTDNDFYYIRIKGTGPTSAAEINHFTVYQEKTPKPEWDYTNDTTLDKDPVTHADPVVIPSPDPDPPIMITEEVPPSPVYITNPNGKIPMYLNVHQSGGNGYLRSNIDNTIVEYNHYSSYCPAVWIPFYLTAENKLTNDKYIELNVKWLQQPTFTQMALKSLNNADGNLIDQVVVTIPTVVNTPFTIRIDTTLFNTYLNTLPTGINLINFRIESVQFYQVNIYLQILSVTTNLPKDTEIILHPMNTLTYKTGTGYITPTFDQDPNGTGIKIFDDGNPTGWWARMTAAYTPKLQYTNFGYIPLFKGAFKLINDGADRGNYSYLIGGGAANPLAVWVPWFFYNIQDYEKTSWSTNAGNTGYIAGLLGYYYPKQYITYEAPPPDDQ